MPMENQPHKSPQGKRKEEAKGVYARGGQCLGDSDILAAELTTKGAITMLFKMIGGKPGDPGLEFVRQESK